jgi:phage shock protein PspC (stress-responsive transcriptional regulator)
MAALTRSNRHKMIAGVCGGFADWLGWNPTAVRVLYIILSIFPGGGIAGIPIYIILWLVMPDAED